jgi:hypothetical protein
MGRTHVVQQGECLTSIAALYGFEDPDAIYQSADNADLRKLRPDPNVIRPGDKIVIPERDRKPMTVKKATGDIHKLQVKLPTRTVRLKLELQGGQSLAGKPFVLTVDGKKIDGQVAGENQIEAKVPATATEGTLFLPDLNVSLRLALAGLDPVRDGDGGPPVASGIQARLHNLGFLGGEPSGRMDAETTAALRRFQVAVLGRADATGEPDDETLSRLVQAHGS